MPNDDKDDESDGDDDSESHKRQSGDSESDDDDDELDDDSDEEDSGDSQSVHLLPRVTLQPTNPLHPKPNGNEDDSKRRQSGDGDERDTGGG